MPHPCLDLQALSSSKVRNAAHFFSRKKQHFAIKTLRTRLIFDELGPHAKTLPGSARKNPPFFIIFAVPPKRSLAIA